MRGMDGVWRDRWGDQLATETIEEARHRRFMDRPDAPLIVTDHEDPFEDG